MIPPILHRVRVGNDVLPEQAEKWARHWRTLHPNWIHLLWTSKNLPPLQNRPLYDASENTGHRADVLRYELLYRYGGVYIDLDVEPLKPLDDLLDVDAFAGRIDMVEQQMGVQTLETAVLGCRPRHPFFAFLLDRLDPWARTHDGPDASVAVRTGPQFFEHHLKEWTRTAGEPGVHLHPSSAFYPYRWDQQATVSTDEPGAYAIHRWWGTWTRQPSDLRFRNGL